MDTLGLIETRSIAAGALLADIMVKAADVNLLRAATLCGGRFLIQVSGDRAAVDASIASAHASNFRIVGSFVISRVHPDIFKAIAKRRDIPVGEALGLVECRTAAAGIASADHVLKKSMVQLARLTLGQCFSGKSYFIIYGDVADVEDAVAEASEMLDEDLIEAIVLPSPDDSVRAALMNKLPVITHI